MHRSYVTKVWLDSFIENKHLPLPKEAAFRFISVLRVTSNETVAVFDGCGREVTGHIIKDNENVCLIDSQLHTQLPPKNEIIVVQAALEEAKIKETIKRGSEYGVDRFIIFDAERSEKFCYKKLMAKKDKLIMIANDACRQAGRLFIPSIDFIPLLKNISFAEGSLGIFGDTVSEHRLSELLQKNPFSHGHFYMVVGAEGGLTEQEKSWLKQRGFFGIIWAPHVLRSELACLAPLAIYHAFKGRA